MKYEFYTNEAKAVVVAARKIGAHRLSTTSAFLNVVSWDDLVDALLLVSSRRTEMFGVGFQLSKHAAGLDPESLRVIHPSEQGTLPDLGEWRKGIESCIVGLGDDEFLTTDHIIYSLAQFASHQNFGMLRCSKPTPPDSLIEWLRKRTDSACIEHWQFPQGLANSVPSIEELREMGLNGFVRLEAYVMMGLVQDQSWSPEQGLYSRLGAELGLSKEAVAGVVDQLRVAVFNNMLVHLANGAKVVRP